MLDEVFAFNLQGNNAMDFLLGVATGYFLTWPALVLVILVGFMMEYLECRKLAVAFGLLAMSIAKFYFDIPLSVIGITAVIYIAIGVFWSFWRYRAYVFINVEMVKSLDEKYRSRRVAELHPTKNLDRITAWIIVWPFSLIEHLIGDLIDAARALVTRVFKGVYYKIYTSLTAGLVPEPEEK